MTSVSPLSNLTSLEILFLNLNSHDSISGLVALTGLRQLNLRDNDIADLSVLLGMGDLTDVWLEGNPLDSHASDTVIPALIDQGAFVVGLKEIQLGAPLLRRRRQIGVDLIERGLAVDLGLAGPEKIQVGTVDNEDALGLRHGISRPPPEFAPAS